jgi:putative colanic acid biosynthesis acetyltransferase WcaF
MKAMMKTTSGVPESEFKERHPLGLGNKAARAAWGLVYALLFRFSPRFPGFWAWRRLLLRCFGATVGRGVMVYPSARIWAPWHLTLGDHSLVGADCDIYCVAQVTLDPGAWVSQYSYLCTASHDFRDPGRPMTCKPIHVGADAWVAADAFIGPGVNVGSGAIVGARSSVFKDVRPGTVVGGNPARPLVGKRARR